MAADVKVPPPRIGIVTHYMPPHLAGIEIVAETLFQWYRDAGCEVRWVASRVPPTVASREEGRIRVRCWNGLERVFSIPWPLWGLQGIREVAQLVKWADLIHVHDCLYFGTALATWLGRRARKPVLLTQHIGFAQYRSPLLNRVVHLGYVLLGQRVLRGASGIVLCTPAAEEFVMRLLGGRPLTARVIPNGIDLARFHPPTSGERAEARRWLNIPEAKWVVLFVGRLDAKKGADVFFEVARQLPEEHFLVIGDGMMRPSGLPQCTWRPFLAPAQMPSAYHAADCLLLPSLSEGFPLSVQEAMACGIPVVVMQGEPFTQFLVAQDACVAVERSAPEICHALQRLKRDCQLTRALATRSRQLAEREWDQAVMGQRYLTLIQQMLSLT